MATVLDGKAWMVATLGGDTPRSNSLFKVGQTDGLLSTGGRGHGPARLLLTDFTAIACMALMIEGPRSARSAVERLWQLPLSIVEVDPGDGTDRQLAVDELSRMADRLDPILCPYFGKVSAIHHGVVDNLIGLLTTLFDHFTPIQDFRSGDELRLEAWGNKRAVRLTLHGPEYGVGVDGWRSEGPAAYRVRLTFGDEWDYDNRAMLTSRTLGTAALNALAALTRPEACNG